MTQRTLSTALGVGHIPESFTQSLDPAGLRGVRIGVMTQSMGFQAEPDTADFRLVSEVYSRAIVDLQEAGADVVELPELPRLKELLAQRTTDGLASERLRPLLRS